MRRRSLAPAIPLLVTVLIGGWATLCTAQQQEEPAAGGAGPSAAPPVAYDQAMARGIRHFNNNSFSAALAEFEQAKTVGPNRADPLYYVGLTLDKLNRQKEAVAPLRQALGLEPRAPRIHFALGVVLFGLQQYDQALPEFTAVEQAEPAEVPSIWTQAMALYYQGLIHHKLGAYARSAPRFLKAMELLPGLDRTAHYYAGIGFFRQGLLEEAREQFEDAIKANPDGSEVARSAKAFLDQIEAEKAKQAAKRWSLQAGISVQSDSNVLTLTEASPLPSGISRREDIRGVLTLRGGYELLRHGRWTGEASYGVYQSLHRELKDFDVQHHSPAAQIVHKGRRVVSRLAYDFAYAALGRSDYLTAHTIAPSALIVWSGIFATQFQYRYQDKDFRDGPRFPTNSVRDGANTTVSLTNAVSFAKKKGNGRLAYAYDRDATRSTDWTYTGHRLTAGTGAPLPREFTGSLEADYYMKRFEYPNSASADGEKRSDNISTYTLSVGHDLGRSFDVGLQYGYTKNGSNLAIFDYSRSVWTLSVTGSF